MVMSQESVATDSEPVKIMLDIAHDVGPTVESGANNHSTPSSELIFHFSNVNFSNKQNARSKTVDILHDVCGEFRCGRLTAILGPSGAGKTSLLNVLSGFKAKDVTGHFTLDGQERNVLTFRKMASYIPQDFAMLDLLTVVETLQVSANLKLPTKTSRAEKRKIIEDILQLLNMEKCVDTLVQHLSGGERKRLSIGIELITNPPLMFFDEPTSGLDSVASLQIMNYLRRLACDGRIIVCVIHQPSSRLMNLFDDVMIMSKGEVLYSGPQREMLPQFEQAGFLCPNYYNPADFVLEVGSEDHNDGILNLIEWNKQKYCKNAKYLNPSSYADEETEMLSKVRDFAEHTAINMTEMKSLEAEDHQRKNSIQSQKSTQRLETVRESTEDVHNKHHGVIGLKEQVSTWCQFTVLMQRSVRSMSRNLIAVQMRVIMHVFVAVLLGIVFWDIGNDGAKVLTNSSCLFFLVMFVFFGNAMPSILLCPQDTAVFLREYLNGWYSVRSYYMAKLISDLPMQFICPTLFILIVYPMTGQPSELGRFAMAWGISLLTAIIGHLIGLYFGSSFELPLAIFLVPGVTIPFMIFSGFFIRLHEVVGFLRPLCDFSFFRYTMEGFMQAIYGYNRPDLECYTDFCYFKSPKKFLKELAMGGDRYGWDISILFIWILFLQVLFYFSLLYRIKRAQ